MANSKTLLKTYCQERHLQLPVYSTEKGDGSSGFTSSVRVCERYYESQAIHPSAQLAEEDAARVAYKNLKQSVTDRISKPAPEIYSRSTGYGYEPLDTTSRATRTPAVASRSCSAQSACTGLVTNGTNTNTTANYSQKLEKLCNAHGLPTPQYVVKESSDAAGNFAATVVVGKGEYLSGTSDSYVEAKEYAALVALAEVGLSLLNINEKEDGREENLEINKQVSRSNDHSPPPVSRTRAHNEYELPEKNYKAMMNEYCQKHYLPLPEYETDYASDSIGFVSVLNVCDKEYQSDSKSTKKKAEQNAAGKAALDVGLVKMDELEARIGSPSLGTSRIGSQSLVNGSVCSSGVGLVDRSAVITSTTSSLLSGGVKSSFSSRFSAGTADTSVAERRWENLEINKQVSGSNDHSPPPVSSTRAHNDYELPEKNYKAMMNEYCQKHYLPLPEYETDYASDSIGFVSVLNVCDKEYQSDSKSTKKKAEQNAAGKAALDIGLVKMDDLEARIGSPSPGTSRIGSRSLVNGSVCSSGVGLVDRSAVITNTTSLLSGEVKSSFSSRFSAGTADTSVAEPITSNYKGVLQEFLAKRGLSNPSYSTVQSCSRLFVSTISLKDLSGKPIQLQGKGYSKKKDAEQSAAKQACIYYELVN